MMLELIMLPDFGVPEFQISFWSNLLATLLASLLFTFWLNRTTSLFKRPKLKLVVKQDGFYRNSILLSEREDGEYEATVQFAIKNEGGQAIGAGEGYWHTYVTTEENTSFSVSGEKNHQRDLITHPVYSQSFTDLPQVWKLLIKRENLENKIPYFFATNYGNFPRTVKMDRDTGSIPINTMGKIGYELSSRNK